MLRSLPPDSNREDEVGFPTFLGKVSDPTAKKSKLNAELANGRLAMMAIIGMFFQDGLLLSMPDVKRFARCCKLLNFLSHFCLILSHWLKHLEASWSTDLGLTGSAWGDWSNYTDSPLRASTQDVLFKGGAGTVDGGMGAGSFGGSKSTSSTSATVSASDLGVQAPTGYWDPLGLNAKADAATFNRRRAVEIKHGRVAMYATIGYIVPEYYKFPGALARNMMDYDGSNIDVRCIQHWSNMDHPWSSDVHTPLRAKYVEVRWSNMKWSQACQCKTWQATCPLLWVLKFTDVRVGLAAISKVPACILETAVCVMGVYMDLWFVTLWLYDACSY